MHKELKPKTLNGFSGLVFPKTLNDLPIEIVDLIVGRLYRTKDALRFCLTKKEYYYGCFLRFTLPRRVKLVNNSCNFYARMLRLKDPMVLKGDQSIKNSKGIPRYLLHWSLYIHHQKLDLLKQWSESYPVDMTFYSNVKYIMNLISFTENDPEMFRWLIDFLDQRFEPIVHSLIKPNVTKYYNSLNDFSSYTIATRNIFEKVCFHNNKIILEIWNEFCTKNNISSNKHIYSCMRGYLKGNHYDCFDALIQKSAFFNAQCVGWIRTRNYRRLGRVLLTSVRERYNIESVQRLLSCFETILKENHPEKDLESMYREHFADSYADAIHSSFIQYARNKDGRLIRNKKANPKYDAYIKVLFRYTLSTKTKLGDLFLEEVDALIHNLRIYKKNHEVFEDKVYAYHPSLKMLQKQDWNKTGLYFLTARKTRITREKYPQTLTNILNHIPKEDIERYKENYYLAFEKIRKPDVKATLKAIFEKACNSEEK